MDATYDNILRMVLWGDQPEDIMHRLEVHGITGDEARLLYQRAMAERVAAIRAHHRPAIWIGLAAWALGTGVFALLDFLTEGFAVTHHRMILIPLFLISFGLWKLASGISGFMTAKSRTGSVSDL